MKITYEFESQAEFEEWKKSLHADVKQDDDDAILLHHTDLCERTVNALQAANIRHLNEVHLLTNNDLYRIPNLGTKAVKEIRAACISRFGVR